MCAKFYQNRRGSRTFWPFLGWFHMEWPSCHHQAIPLLWKQYYLQLLLYKWENWSASDRSNHAFSRLHSNSWHSSSSSSLACPVIWGRWYSWLASFSILPCLLRCPLSTLPVSYLSYTHISNLGLAALFFFSLVCLHLAFFSLCAPLSFSSHGRTTSVVFL